MTEGAVWWLALEARGLASFPIAFSFFRFLPDRGYAFAKVLGLLLMSYILWIGAMAHVIPNERWSILLILVAMALTSAAILVRRRDEFVSYVRHAWPIILATEVVFGGVLLAVLFYNSYFPVISEGEEPTDFLMLNAVFRSQFFPPEDPWLSGSSVRYYFFGHLMMGTVAKLTGTASATAFNLGSGLTAALTAAGAFSLVFNLVGPESRRRRAATFGLVGVVLVLLLSNLEAVFELLSAHGVGSNAFYDTVGIFGLEGPRPSSNWYPPPDLWWGRINIISTPFDARDFPFNKVALGGMRPDFMTLPFQLLAMAAGLTLLRADRRLDLAFIRDAPVKVALVGLVLGVLVFVDPWSLPTYALFLAGLILMRNYFAERNITSALKITAPLVAVVLALAVLLFLPAWILHLPSGQSGIGVLEAYHPLWCGKQCTVTRPHHFLLQDLTTLWLPASFSIYLLLAAGRRRLKAPTLAVAALLASLPLAFWALHILVQRKPWGLAQEIWARGISWVTVFIAFTLLFAAVTCLTSRLVVPRHLRQSVGILFSLAALCTGLLILVGLEFFWVKDISAVRNNTTLRLNTQAWLLLGVGSAYGLHRMTAVSWRPALFSGGARIAWYAATTIVISAALVYPVTISFSRTNGFNGPRSLDGLVASRIFEPHEYEAISWLNRAVSGTPVVLEAFGPDFSTFGRVSLRTGLPTVLGWTVWHERVWRGGEQAYAGRPEDIETIYRTLDVAEARELLGKYEVEYVYVGRLEREQYGGDGLPKFGTFMDVIFQNQEVTIYRMRGEGS